MEDAKSAAMETWTIGIIKISLLDLNKSCNNLFLSGMAFGIFNL